MTCKIVNLTEYTFTNTQVVHNSFYTINDELDSIEPFKPREILNLTVRVGWQGYDHWYFYLYVDGRLTLSRENKICNIKAEDFDNGGPIFLILYPRGYGFSIHCPVSESCLNNHYA